MRGAQTDELDSLRAVVEHKMIRERQGSKLLPRVFEAVRRVVPFRPAIGSAGSCLFVSGFRAHDHRSGIHEDRVAVCVISVIVGVQYKANGLVGRRSDPGKNLACAPWKIGIHNEHVVVENHPHAICGFALVPVSLPNIDSRGKILYLSRLCMRSDAANQRNSKNRRHCKPAPRTKKSY